MAITKIKLKQIESSSTPGSFVAYDASNVLSIIAPTTGADRIPFYDDSATAGGFLTLGTNLSITGTTINASAGAGGYSEVQEEGSALTARTKINFIGGGFTAADDAGNTRTNVTLASQLNTFAAYNTNGIFTQTAAGTYTGRTITGTASRITITNGDGVSGNPTIDINTSYVGQSSITTLGTITTGTWNGTAIAAANGGTGQTSYAVGDLLYANTTSTLAKLADVATGSVLKSGGVSTAPSWGTLASTDLTNSANIALLNGTQTISGTYTFSNNVTLNGTPSAGTDAVNVNYVNNLITGLKAKGAVRVATTAILTASAQTSNTITLGGTTLSIDSISLANSDRVLVKDSVTGGSGGTFNNGIYTVGGIGSSVVLTRATDMDAWTEVPAAYTFVEVGTTNADTGWLCTSDQGGTLGTTAITFVKFAGVGAGVTSVAATAPSAGFTISGSPITTSGTFVFTLADDLAAVEALASNGLVTRTASNTWTTRTATGTTNRLTVTNGDGVSGNPTFDIAATYVGQSSITTLGTITTGVWNGTTVAVANGGTGLTAGTSGGVLYYSATGTLASSGALTDNVIVLGGGAGSAPTSLAAGLGTTTTVLHGNAGGEPTWGAISLTADVTGTLPIANGGTNITTYTTGDILYASSTNVLAKLPIGSTGNVLKVAGGVPSWSTGGATVTRAYLTGSTSSVIDLDSGTAVTDIDGSNIAFTVPTDLELTFVVRNGILLSRSGTVSRDYTLVSATGVLTLASALTTDESLMVYKLG